MTTGHLSKLGKNTSRAAKIKLEHDITQKFKLAPPSTIVDLDQLAESTKMAFDLLVPWCHGTQSLPALIPISQQANLYVQAIDYSIAASQAGFNLAEEALGFAASLCADEANSTRTAESHKLADDAMTRFRNVREKMTELIDKAKTAKPTKQDEKSLRILSELESKISVLECFSGHISLYADWWSGMEMAHVSQKSRTEQQAIDYSSMRETAVIMKWKELQKSYEGYTDKIRVLQDTHGTLFVESKRMAEEKKRSPLSKLLTGLRSFFKVT
ncbi:hypothetical protein B0H34DRAFT_65591 [Crassisporium funariophilum]|nr:hypothetical protein B0H34DRAFT_65591 [Crassisporium funariophilum]